MAEAANEDGLEQMKIKERKINFLNMEMTDIKHNKGGANTLQTRTIEHLQNWLKRDQTVSSELNIKPLELTAELIKQQPRDHSASLDPWWDPNHRTKSTVKDKEDNFNEPVIFKKTEVKNQVLELAQKLKMTTDVKKAILHAIVLADDYLIAFENCQRLNLKSQQ